MHIAAAMNVKAIGLFGPNLPVRFGPLNKKSKAIYKEMPCSPCINVHKGQVPECMHGETSKDYQTAKFRAGHAGWQNGGKIVLLDENEQPYTIVVNRINRIVTLKKGDVELLMPKDKKDVPF